MTTAHGIWLFLTSWIAAVIVLLLIGEQRSIRLRNLLMPSLLVLVFRSVAWLMDHSGDSMDIVGFVVIVTLAAVALAGRRAWIVRTTDEALMAELVAAGTTVRITCQQGVPRELILLLKEGPAQIRIRPLATGLQLLIFPQTSNGKFKLFASLLRKRYPRVWPRFSVSLSRSKE